MSDQRSHHLIQGIGVLLLLSVFICVTAVSAFEAQAPAAELIEARSGKILYAKNPDLQREPASTTKVLTALVAVESAKDLDALVKVSVKAASTEGSSAGLKPGMQIPLRELLYAMLMMSGNDAAVAVAEHIAGNVPAFVALMNTRAKAAGATRSNFVNPSGLPDPKQYTTVHDLALIGRAAMQNKVLAEIFATKEHRFAWLDTPTQNHNRLLWTVSGADGIKNGYTTSAKHTWVGSVTRDGLRLITAVLGADSKNIVLDDQKAMFDYGFALYEKKAAVTKGEVVGKLPVRGGEIAEVDVITAAGAQVWTLSSESAPVEKRIELPDQLRAPISGDEVLGTVKYVAGDEVLAEVALKPATSVAPLPPLAKVGRYTLLSVKWGSVGALGTVGLAIGIRTYNLTRKRYRLWRQRRDSQRAWRQERRLARLRRMSSYNRYR